MLSGSLKVITCLLLLFLCSGIAVANGDENDIQKLLQENAGGVCILPAGTYTLNGQSSIHIPDGTILQGTTDAAGNWLTIIEYGPNQKLEKQEAALTFDGRGRVCYIDFRGNSENRPTIPYWRGHSGNQSPKKKGQGYDNFLGGKHFHDVEVDHCRFTDSLGDCLRFWYCNNVSFHDNYASEAGHDVFYGVQSEGLTAYNNYIEPAANSALRIMDCSGVLFYNNTIAVVGDDPAGPAIQIQNDKGEMRDIEVCYNTIVDSDGTGFWIVGKTGSGHTQAHIHHNVLYRPGKDRIYWVGGMVISGYDGLLIENNVFDGAYRAGILYWAYNGAWGTKAHSDIKANIFVDSVPGALDNRGGYGVSNEISEQSVSSDQNCYYHNADGNTNGCSVSNTDIFVNPRTTATPSGYTWDSEKSRWTCPNMPMPSLNYTPSGVYNNSTPITPEEEEEFEFDNIFDILNGTFTDSGRNNQTAADINYTAKQTSKGKVAGYIKIVGFSNISEIDGEKYIPDEKSVLVKYDAVKSPDLLGWKGQVSSIKKEVKVEIKGGKAYAVLKVKMRWFIIDTDPKTHESFKKYRTTEVEFKDSAPAPKILERPTNKTAYINVYNNKKNPNSRISVSGEGLQKIVFQYGNRTSTHTFMIGERMKDKNGVLYTNYTRVDSWEGDLPNLDALAILYGNFDESKLKITCYTPYESFETRDFKIVNHDMAKGIWLFSFTKSILKLIFMAIIGYKLMESIFS